MSILLILCFAPAGALAQAQGVGGGWDLRTTLEGPPLGMVGIAFDSSVDLNSDGWNDVLVSIPGWLPPSYFWQAGGAVVLEAGSGREIWRFLPPDDPDYWHTGNAVSFVPDLDGDGFHDCLVASKGYPASGLDPGVGTVFVLNGLTASIIREHFGSTTGSGVDSGVERLGWSVLGIEDITSDGRGEYLITSPESDLGQGTRTLNGEVECFSGATGALVWRYSGQPNELLGKALARGPDLTGDRIPEVLVSASGAYFGSDRLGKVYVLDARTGNRLLTLDGLADLRVPSATGFGEALGTSTRLDSDAVADIIVGAVYATTAAGNEAGYVAAFSGASGQLLWRHDSDVPGAQFGTSVSGLDDLDLDGYTEVLVGAPGMSTDHPSGIGEASVLSGKDGSLLWRIATSPAHYQAYGLVVRGYGQNGRLDHALISEPFLGPVSDGAIHVVEFQPFIQPSALAVSSASGGLVHYRLDFPPSEAGIPYALLASASGRGPTLLGGLIVPLTQDAALYRCIANRYPPEFLSPRGTLDAQGDADAGLTIAPGRLASFVGRTIHLAAVIGDAGTGRLSSIAVPLAVRP